MKKPRMHTGFPLAYRLARSAADSGNLEKIKRAIKLSNKYLPKEHRTIRTSQGPRKQHWETIHLILKEAKENAMRQGKGLK